MFVRFPKAIPGPNEIEWIRIRELQERFPLGEDFRYTQKIEKKGLDFLLTLVMPEKGVSLSPFGWCYGAGYGFYHIHPTPDLANTEAKSICLFSFDEGDLPELKKPSHYVNLNRFNYLAKHFMEKTNIERLVSAGLDVPVNYYGKYAY
ncbi:hypothetical protein J4408_00200 [Candidatus Pacearchaeota archaeon]|nr:hypothetical protein [Candidatus Pacearchaeota archaeon]